MMMMPGRQTATSQSDPQDHGELSQSGMAMGVWVSDRFGSLCILSVLRYRLNLWSVSPWGMVRSVIDN